MIEVARLARMALLHYGQGVELTGLVTTKVVILSVDCSKCSAAFV